METILELKNICISFGGIKAVQDVSFNVNKGEILGLIGPNGSGKSTCVNLISGVYQLDSGEILFNGEVIPPKMKIFERAQLGMARTFQTPKPYGHMTVYDNILATALLKYNFAAAYEKTESILEETGLESVQHMLSAQLPIEKRKWLDLARCLATDAQFIMMDEVMAGLNTNEMTSSLDLVSRINKKGVTVLFIEHVMNAVMRICDRVVVLNTGKVLAEGETKEVLNRPDVMAAYIGGGIKK